MNRMVLAVLLALYAMPAQADTLPLLIEAPTTYTPGQEFTVDVRLPGAVDLTGFSIELLFTTTVLNPDFLVSAIAIDGSYPFASTSNFNWSQAHDPDTNVEMVTIFTDPDAGPVNTILGQPDLLGRILITPGANVTGPIMISVNDGTLRLDIGGEPVPEIELPILTLEQNEANTPVPTPAAWLSLGVGGMILAARRRMNRVSA